MRGREVGIDLLERGGVLAPQVRRCPHAGQQGGDALLGKRGEDGVEVLAHRFRRQAAQAVVGPEFDDRDVRLVGQRPRSEEHTSELQSLMRISYAVFCLKTKTTRRYKHISMQE